MAAATEPSAVTAFAQQVADLVEQLKKTGEPLVVTINGKAQFVARDLKAYYRLIEVLEQAETLFALRRALESRDRGEGRPAAEVMAEIRKEHGLPG
jgi:PHD/YefM family antitoxin component YafN of YafNO toxin-antitoxin module